MTPAKEAEDLYRAFRRGAQRPGAFCGQTHPRTLVYCTRPKGHDGTHVAFGLRNGRVKLVGEWPRPSSGDGAKAPEEER